MAVDGTYSITIKTPMGDQPGTVTLKAEGGALTGEMPGPTGQAQIKDGSVEGDNVKCKADITSPMPMTLEFDGKVEGDAISGNVQLGAFGSSTFAGARA